MLRMLSLPPALQHIAAMQTVGQSTRKHASCMTTRTSVSGICLDNSVVIQPGCRSFHRVSQYSDVQHFGRLWQQLMDPWQWQREDPADWRLRCCVSLTDRFGTTGGKRYVRLYDCELAARTNQRGCDTHPSHACAKSKPQHARSASGLATVALFRPS